MCIEYILVYLDIMTKSVLLKSKIVVLVFKKRSTMNNLCKLSNGCKGIIYIFVGIILLLHTLGFLERSLRFIIIFGSLAFIVYGSMILYQERTIKESMKKLMKMFKKEEKKE